jgi:PqqA family
MDAAAHRGGGRRWRPPESEQTIMTWATPVLVELCIGLEINGYLPAEF